ncbi:MAG: hypothetical protein ACLP1Y_07745 [Candidatus Acidiferrales bacterium]
MEKRATLLCCLVLTIAAPAFSQTGPGRAESKLVLESSDAQLVTAFNWAKQQAMAYVADGDPVGPWYEAALPGREAFCMRDVSHQSMGAQALGLSVYTLNMLHRFAENVSDSKDWCSYWEINRYNKPATADYKSDAEFWYDLPANFDVLDACYRMYLWTGDPAYINDPVFLNYYEKTVVDFVNRWDLGTDGVMKRKRFLNERGEFDPSDSFQFYRGDPGYAEQREDFVLDVSLLDTQYAAYQAYAFIEGTRGDLDAAQTYLKKATDVKALVNNSWWDDSTHHFHDLLKKDYQFEGNASSDLLYRNVAEDGPKAQSALNDLLDSVKANPSSGVEGESHYPEILYRYGAPEVAYQEIMDLTRDDRDRREYPEVSYSVVGAIVTGLIGVTLQTPSPLEAGGRSDYLEVIVKTLPGLSAQTAWAELRNLPVRSNFIGVRQEGLRKTALTNETGPSLIWQATFPGSFDTLLVNGKPMKATAGKEPLGRATSWVRVQVGAGDTVRVEAPK